MWVQLQALAPSVQYRDHPQFCAQLFRVVPKGTQRFPNGVEQDLIERSGMSKRHGVQRIGQCEDHMKIGHGKQFGRSCRYPPVPFMSLTGRTVPVATGIEL